MRSYRSWIVAGGLVAYASTAQTADLHGYLLPMAERSELRESEINPGNALGVPDTSTSFAVGLNGPLWRVHAEHASGSTRVRLQELAKTFPIGDRVSIAVGKRVLSWDVALSSTPLGFFQRTPDLSDVTDRFERTEGLPLIAVSYVGSVVDMTVVYSDRFTRRSQQTALNVTGNFSSGTYSLVLQKPEDEALGIGLSLVASPHDSLTVNVSGITRRGSIRPISQRVLDRALGSDVADPNGEWRRNASQRFTRWVAGLQWAPSPTASWIAEWSHNDAALNRDDWNFWTQLVAYHRSPEVLTPLQTANLAFDAQTLIPAGARRDYLFVRHARAVGRNTFSLLTRRNMDDGSTIAGASIDHTFNKTLIGGISLTYLLPHGSNSELHYVPVSSSVQLWFKRAFLLSN